MINAVCWLRAIFHLSILFGFSLAHAQVNGVQAIAGEYIVKIKSKSGVSANGRLSVGMKLVSKMGSAIKVKQAFWGSEMMHIKADSQASIDALRANSDVEFVEPNYILSVDPVEIKPFGVAPDNSDNYDQSNSNVRVTDSWSIQKPYNQGTKTVVAIIDTGLDTTHGLFADSNSIWTNEAELNGLPGVDDDGNGYIDDVHGWNYVSANPSVLDDDDHGTHVAGIVLGVGQDVLSYPVRESKISIMALKFLDSHGSGSTANAVNAMYYAVNMGAKVINNSWGGSSYSRSLHEAYTYAFNHGVVVVSAAGNSGTNNDTSPMYPASLDTPNNIAVAATTDSDSKASFSNYGSRVAVGAPGVAIISSVPGTGCLSPGCYQMMSGTSMAAPFVTGLAALLVREAPQLSAFQIKSLILSSADTISSLNGKVSSGGRVNAYNAVLAAQAQSTADT
jgi:thermitase